MSNTNSTLLLASASSRRFDLLCQINMQPDTVFAPEIDEKRLKNERVKDLPVRLAEEKAKAVQKLHTQECFILAADTVVTCGPQNLDKAETEDDARSFLQKLSGRRHKVYGGIAVIAPNGKLVSRLVTTMVQFKTLSKNEIESYIASGEWEGKAGGYAIQGRAAAFVKSLSGSYTNVVGLSLYDTMQILNGLGFKAPS